MPILVSRQVKVGPSWSVGRNSLEGVNFGNFLLLECQGFNSFEFKKLLGSK